MRLIFFILCLFFSSMVFAKTNYVHIQTWKTAAGTPVYFVKTNAVPIIDVSTVFHAGSAFDGPNYGLASLTNVFIGEQSKNLNSTQIAEKMNAVGMLLDSNIDRDKAVVHFRSLSDKAYFNPSLALYTEVLSHLSISTDTFNRVKSQMINQIKSEQEDPSNLASDAFFSALYGDAPYGHPSSGTIDSVNALTLEQINQFYSTYYSAKNAIIVIVGDTDLLTAKLISEQISTSLPLGELMPQPSEENNKPINKTVFIDHAGSENTIIIGQLGVERKNPQLIPLQVGNTILGDMSMSSLLMETLRNKNGLVYSVDSNLLALKNRGPFFIILQTKSAQAQKALDLAKNELLQFAANGPSAEQLDTSKKFLVGSFPFSYATNSNILANVINIAFFGLPLDYMDTYQDKINAVTLTQIQNDFKNLIQANDLITVNVGQQNNTTLFPKTLKNEPRSKKK